jgi:hypothetical protein
MSASHDTCLFDDVLPPKEAEARCGLLMCPRCDSRQVAVHKKRHVGLIEYGCLECGAYSTNNPNRGESYNRVDSVEARGVGYRGTIQSLSDVDRSLVEKLRRKVSDR